MKVPVAVNCCVVPRGIVAVGGLIAIETSVAAVTVRSADPLIEPDDAVIVALPIATLCANPALMVATDCVSDDQVAVEVRSCVLLSVKVPVAVNCCVVPKAIDGFAGETAIETSAAAVTVSVVEPVTEPEVATMLAVP